MMLTWCWPLAILFPEISGCFGSRNVEETIASWLLSFAVIVTSVFPLRKGDCPPAADKLVVVHYTGDGISHWLLVRTQLLVPLPRAAGSCEDGLQCASSWTLSSRIQNRSTLFPLFRTIDPDFVVLIVIIAQPISFFRTWTMHLLM